MNKKTDSMLTPTKPVGSIIISGKGNDFTGAAIGGKKVNQKNITKNYYSPPALPQPHSRQVKDSNE